MKAWMRTGVALAAVAALTLTACGRNDATTDTAKPIGEGKATGEITVWAMGTEGEKLDTLAKAFMAENPDATVKVTAVPWDGAHDKISSAIAGGETPDISMIGSTWMGEFANTGGLDPTPDAAVDKAAYFTSAWDSTVVNGTSFAVPWYVETRLVYVNKAVAQKAGITEAPKTWTDFKAAMTAFRDKGGADLAIDLKPGGTGTWQSVLPFVWQNGGDVYSGSAFTFDDPKVSEALAYWKSFFTEGLAITDLPNGELEPRFVAGKIGAFVSGPWHIGLLNDQGGKDKFQVWHMPTQMTGASFLGGSNLAVFKDAKNRDGAWKFIQYLSRPQVQVTWYQTVADLPAVTKSWEDESLADDPLLAAFGEQLRDTKAPPTIATWEQVAAAFDTELEKLAKTTVTPDDVAKTVQQKAVSIGTGS